MIAPRTFVLVQDQMFDNKFFTLHDEQPMTTQTHRVPALDWMPLAKPGWLNERMQKRPVRNQLAGVNRDEAALWG